MKSKATSADHREVAATQDVPDQRAHQRAITVYRVVRIEHEGREGLARCRNISDSGARLDVGMDIQLNDMVDIAFSDETVVSARVVWTNGNDCGVAFAREVDSAALLSRPSADAPQRATRSPRLHADFLARVWNGYATIKSRVSNISQRGMRLSHDGSFHEGLHVKILLPGGRERAAVVRWSKDDIAGVYLLEPFSAVELGSITGLSGS